MNQLSMSKTKSALRAPPGGMVRTCFVFAFAWASSHAGPWPRRPGTGIAAVSGSFLSASSVVDEKGKTHEYGIRETGVNAYGEIGIRKHWSLGFGMTPFKSVETDSFDVKGWSDLEMSLTRHLGGLGPSVFGLSLQGTVPLGTENPDNAPDYLYAVLGQNSWALGIMPEWGMSRGAAWYQAGLGLRVRGDDRVGQFRYQLTGGYRFGESKRVGARASFSGVAPLSTHSNGLPSDQEQYFGLQLAADWRASRALSLFIQADEMTPPPKEEPLGARINFGFNLNFPFRS